MSPKALRLIRDFINLFFVFHIFFAGLFYYLSGFISDNLKIQLSIAFIAYFIPVGIAVGIDNYINRIEGTDSKSDDGAILVLFIGLLLSLLLFHITYYLTNKQIIYSILAGLGGFLLTPVLFTYLKGNPD